MIDAHVPGVKIDAQLNPMHNAPVYGSPSGFKGSRDRVRRMRGEVDSDPTMVLFEADWHFLRAPVRNLQAHKDKEINEMSF